MDFIGNKKIIDLLSKSLKNEMLGHAYIFCGPEKVGKFTFAKMFATALIKNSELSLEVGQNDKDAQMDLVVIEPEMVEKNNVLKQRDISIESIRDAKLSLSLFPYHGKFKILIVNDAHKINLSAQNALLKILEEPNQTTKIILVTHEADKILPTIFSRAQVVNFGLAGEKELEDYFDSNTTSLCLGRPGIALALKKNEEQGEFIAQTNQQLEIILGESLNEKISLAEKLSKDIIKTIEKFNIWIWQLRKRALSLDGKELGDFYYKIEKIEECLRSLKNTNANSRLILEALFIDL